MEVINLNLIPSGASPVAHAAQFDTGRVTRFNLLEGTAPYTLDGTETLTVCVRKPDGHVYTNTVTNTGSNYIEVTTAEQMTACAGANLATIKIEKGSDTIATLNYFLMVQVDPEDGGDQSASFIHDLEEQIYAAVADQYDADSVVFDPAPTPGHGVGFAVTSEGIKNAIPEELDDLQDMEITSPTAGQIIEYDDNGGKWKNVANPASTTNFGAPYDENNTYNVPSLVIYNNLLYKLNEGEDGTTGPWDPTKWTQTSLAELTAEDFPLSSTDPTPVATAIGSLSALTTSDKSSLVGAVNSIYPTKDIGGTAKGVGGTYQIPAGVLSHSIITIALRRYAYAGEVTILAENITAGAYTNGLTVFGAHDKYAEFSISTTGLITITAIQNWAEVYIDLIGIF